MPFSGVGRTVTRNKGASMMVAENASMVTIV
jgi:hypothetical protein